VDRTKKIGYKTSLPKYSEVLRLLSLLDREDLRRVSIIRNTLNLSNEEFEETLRFLECIGAVKREKRRCLITSYGKTVLTRLVPVEYVPRDSSTE